MECVYNHNGITCACATDGLTQCRYKVPEDWTTDDENVRRTDLSKPQGYIHATTPPGPRHCISTVTPSLTKSTFDEGVTRMPIKWEPQAQLARDLADRARYRAESGLPPDAPPSIRSFDTGATRDLDETKYDYEAFLSPLVVEAFGRYMHRKRRMADGTWRDGDNWQKGIPLDSYMKSGWRHLHDWWKHHRGLPVAESLEDALCALMFNVMGYLHEHLKSTRG